jgi:hypothetical protein
LDAGVASEVTKVAMASFAQAAWVTTVEVEASDKPAAVIESIVRNVR